MRKKWNCKLKHITIDHLTIIIQSCYTPNRPMTNLIDYMNDLANEVLQAEREAVEDGQVLTNDAVKNIIDDTIISIKSRLIGE